MIADWLERPDVRRRPHVSTTDVLSEALSLTLRQMDSEAAELVASCLRAHGWRRVATLDQSARRAAASGRPSATRAARDHRRRLRPRRR